MIYSPGACVVATEKNAILVNIDQIMAITSNTHFMKYMYEIVHTTWKQLYNCSSNMDHV